MSQSPVTVAPVVRPPSALAALLRLRARNGDGIYASDGDLFNGAIFGRDACEAAEDLLDIEPAIARDVIRTLAGLQATAASESGPYCNEAERGRIHHELRRKFIEGKPIVGEALTLFENLRLHWGGVGDEVLYYGSIDSTPLYIRLVARYCGLPGGESILDERVIRNGEEVTVRECVSAAVDWMVTAMETSSLGLLEFQRRNVPYGIPHQAWKDSSTAYVHVDGTLANHDAPIASIEVQGLAYDALLGAVAMLGGTRPDDARVWLAWAAHLRRRVMTTFWMEDQRYFAQAIDRDHRGYPRIVRTITSNPATLLDTGIFDDLPERQRRRYLSGIVERVFSPELLTPVGVRCRRLGQEGDIVPFSDYHGAHAVWIKETFDIAKGLRRQGFARLADELDSRILNAVNEAGAYLEFFYVHGDGAPVYAPKVADGAAGDGLAPVIAGTNVPDQVQAWTVSAVLAIKRRNGARAA